MSIRTKRNTFFLLIVGIALVIVAVAAFALTAPRSQPVAPTNPAAASPPEVQRVTLEESKAALENNAAVFLDVRSESAYETSHIPGAVSIPLAQLEPRIGELDPEQWIITYCTWPAEESSARAAEILFENGFTRVNPVLGGFGAWISAGYPVDSSP